MSTVGTTSGTFPVRPNSPVSSIGYLWLQGLQLSYLTTATFSVGQGQARDSTNIFDIIIGGNRYAWENQSNPQVAPEISSPVVVNTAVNGAGGLDVGTIAASSFYYVYAIGASSGDLPGSVVISLSGVKPVLPSVINEFGSVAVYDCYRYIGTVATNGSSELLPFTQVGNTTSRTVLFSTPIAPGATPTTGSTTYTTIGALLGIVPQRIVNVLVNATITGNAVGDQLFLAPYGNTAAGSTAVVTAFSTTVPNTAQVSVPTAFNATPVVEIDYKTTSASDTVAFTIAGYVDNL
jgi:hypothetical protein